MRAGARQGTQVLVVVIMAKLKVRLIISIDVKQKRAQGGENACNCFGRKPHLRTRGQLEKAVNLTLTCACLGS